MDISPSIAATLILRTSPRTWGKRFYADRVIKPYSACRATHSAIDSALKIACSNNIRIEDIKEVTVHVTSGVLNGFTGQPFVLGETPQIDGAFSVRYTVATALLRKVSNRPILPEIAFMIRRFKD